MSRPTSGPGAPWGGCRHRFADPHKFFGEDEGSAAFTVASPDNDAATEALRRAAAVFMRVVDTDASCPGRPSRTTSTRTTPATTARGCTAPATSPTSNSPPPVVTAVQHPPCLGGDGGVSGPVGVRRVALPGRPRRPGPGPPRRQRLPPDRGRNLGLRRDLRRSLPRNPVRTDPGQASRSPRGSTRSARSHPRNLTGERGQVHRRPAGDEPARSHHRGRAEGPVKRAPADDFTDPIHGWQTLLVLRRFHPRPAPGKSREDGARASTGAIRTAGRGPRRRSHT